MTTQVTVDIGLIAFDIRPRPLADEVTRSLVACLSMLASEFPAQASFRLRVLGGRKQNTWRPIVSLFQPHWMRQLTHTWDLFLPDSPQELLRACKIVVCFEGYERHELLEQGDVRVVECSI